MLRLYNTMTRNKKAFKPRKDKEVKIFTCGPSIYRRAHLGNYRTFIYEDVLLKYLEYLGYKIQRVINFTDVEDKIIQEARQQNSDIKKLAEEVADYFYKETKLLNIKLPETIPRSSTTVPQAVRLINSLIDKEYAYWHRGDVFFNPLKFRGFGKLFHLDMGRWPKKKVRFKKDTYIGRRWNRGDFVLWHGFKKGDHIFWDTEIGKGRPSWNIQDPAIITENLGYMIDINCGGIDNIYRHHDYNIAIIESLSGQDYANYYLHGEHLTVDGRPMSKSRGNIRYLEDMLDKACHAGHIRFFLIYTHYRKKLNLTEKKFRCACAYLNSFHELVNSLSKPGSPTMFGNEDRKILTLVKRISTEFEENMNDDLAVGAAFDSIYSLLKEVDRIRKSRLLSFKAIKCLAQQLKRIDSVLGVIY